MNVSPGVILNLGLQHARVDHGAASLPPWVVAAALSAAAVSDYAGLTARAEPQTRPGKVACTIP